MGTRWTSFAARSSFEPIVAAVRAGTPYLGFCLGLQPLFEVGTEDGEHKGLGILGGRVEKFDFGPDLTSQRLRIPHMGWNQVHWTKDCPMLRGIEQGAYVYFAHSYYPVPADSSIVVTTTDYGLNFCFLGLEGQYLRDAVPSGKSQAVGLKLLENFVKL